MSTPLEIHSRCGACSVQRPAAEQRGNHLQYFKTMFFGRQGQNLALTVLCVPRSLHGGSHPPRLGNLKNKCTP